MTAARPDNEAIFHAARDVPDPGRRRDYVRQACGGDAARVAHVEALLAAADAPDSLLDRPAGCDPAATTDRPTMESAGTVIGPYKLIEPIGEGGMGTVWMAQQSEPVKRLVAVKLIKAGMDSRQVIARFEAERQALALMEHPNIARVLEAGTTGAGRPYFVMDLVKGVPITQYCDEHRLMPRQRLELFISVCRAVQHAHQKGVIHRDLKPSNVLVALYDGRPVPKVIDFGVAKAAGQPLTEKTLVTGFGAIVGTLEYMSPEQAEVNQLDIDTRSDIYALGVLLYELLTGSPPFGRKELEEGGVLEMLRLIREQEPTRPSTKLSTAEGLPTLAANRGTEPAKLAKLVRGELDWIVMKALEKDRNRRYDTAGALAADVQRYLHDEPVQACPPSTSYRLMKFVRRNKGSLGVAAGLFLALAVMAASIGWAVRDRAARATEAERAEVARRAGLEVRFWDALRSARTLVDNDKLASAREKLVEARAELGSDAAALDNLAAAVAAAAADLDRLQQYLELIERAQEAELAPSLEPTMLGRDEHRRPDAAVPLILEALALYGVLERADWNSTLEGGFLGGPQVEQIRRLAYERLLWLADDVVRRRQDHQSGQKVASEAAARQALVYLGKAETVHRPTKALYELRSRCHKSLGEAPAAEAAAHRAEQTPATLAVDHFLGGQAAYSGKQLEEGVQAFEAALRLEPTHYWSLNWLGCCYCDLGREPAHFAAAANVFTGCILRWPDHAHPYHCRGNAYFKLRRYDDAVADYARALELNPNLVTAWQNRGIVYQKLGQWDKAFADSARAIELAPEYASAWLNRGAAYSKLGQKVKAVADFSKALELNPKYTLAWINRGNEYVNSGQADKGAADLAKAIELEPNSAPAWNHRAVAYLHLGQADKAAADSSKAIEVDATYVDAWSTRGLANRRLGQADKAVADYSRAIELEPKRGGTWYGRGVVYLSLGRLDRAQADFSRAIELNPKDAQAWINRGVTYAGLGQTAKAVADYSKAIEVNPKDARAWYNRGLGYQKLGQTHKAVADFSRALEEDPKFAAAWVDRGVAYLKLGQPDKAFAHYSKAIELDPKYALAWNNRGLAYLRLGQPDKAIADGSRAVELAPKAGNYWSTLGVAYYRAGDWKAAIAALDKSLELPPGADAGDWFFRAMAQRKLGHHDEARTAYEHALQWLEKNQETLNKDKGQAEELRRFRAEAEQVLELTKK